MEKEICKTKTSSNRKTKEIGRNLMSLTRTEIERIIDIFAFCIVVGGYVVITFLFLSIYFAPDHTLEATLTVNNYGEAHLEFFLLSIPLIWFFMKGIIVLERKTTREEENNNGRASDNNA